MNKANFITLYHIPSHFHLKSNVLEKKPTLTLIAYSSLKYNKLDFK